LFVDLKMNDMYFKDKVIWITGASSGIGEGLVYALAREGARLIISSRKQPELERVKNNCPEGSQVMVLPLDVADFEALPGAAEKVLAEFGQIDILINNAGISQRELIIDTDLSTDRKLMDVNYLKK
jgi:dehydrogenase/reductase SDR family protein 7